jgi:uncharacterized protein YbjT (DUF2867 family)
VPVASVLVLGASGQVGSRLTPLLVDAGVAVRAFHDPSTGPNNPLPDGVDEVRGSFDDTAALRRAMAGMDAAFLLTPPSASQVRWQRAMVQAAVASGIGRVVKLSAFGSDDGTRLQMGRWHRDGEEALAESGLDHVVLRPQYFMQMTSVGMRQALATGVWRGAAAPDVALAVVDTSDVAAVAARVLTQPGHEGDVLFPTGPEAVTFRDMAARLSIFVGRAIPYQQRPHDEVRAELTARGWPDWHIDDYFMIHGEAASPLVTDCVADVTGKRPISFEQFLRSSSLHL